ncbi:MAG: amidohydrolase family protein [Myxococcales bacterium]|nr:amidohydrolase family protein [Myxococcales bacterium]
MLDKSLLIRGGLVFCGRGARPHRADVVIVDGRVAAIGADLKPPPGAQILGAEGCWVMPGFIDLHTHYDAEVEVAPALLESVRHGVTTVVLGSCSLSMGLGEPSHLADMFCRVEAVPRSVVLPILEARKDWHTPAQYLDHLDRLPLGPNLACLLGHSTLRVAAMGLERSVTEGERPTEDEMARMLGWLDEALDAGYLGLSISLLQWDRMDGDVVRSRPMPSVFARWREYRRFARTLRRRNRVLQAVPSIVNKSTVVRLMLGSAGWLRPRLKTTLLSLMDVRADRLGPRLLGGMTWLINRLFRADVRLQMLPQVFDLWADGIDLVVFEEFEAGGAALHLQDAADRRRLLDDAAYRARFKQQWRDRWLPKAFHRDFAMSEVLACPDAAVVGRSFADIAAERGCDAVDAFLDLVSRHGTALRWYTVMGNDRPEVLQRFAAHPDILIGFSDAGAHLRNMAHYNYPLSLLRAAHAARATDRPFMSVERAVQRLTSEIADWMGLDAGVLEVGGRADVAVIDPAGLTDEVDAVVEQPVPAFGLTRLVRRNDAAVPWVIIGGRLAAEHGKPAPGLGTERGFGRVLRAKSP